DLISTTTTFNLLETTATTINFASAATTLNIADSAVATTIDIAVDPTAADTITIGNSHISSSLTVMGGTAWSINASGQITTNSNIAVNGGTVSSTAALTISSSGGDISFGPSGSGTAYVTAGDDFAVGAATLVAPFSVDESTNIVRIGDGTSDDNDPSIVFYASNGADSGTFNYNDDDVFKFSGGNISHTGLGNYATVADSTQNTAEFNETISGTSTASMNAMGLNAASGNMAYAGIEHVTSTDHIVGGVYGANTLTGATTTLSGGYGVFGKLVNSSTNASLVQGSGFLAGVEGEMAQKGVATIGGGYGVHGKVSATAGTITDAAGVMGEVASSAGTLTRSYGGRFDSSAAGTTRYGVWASASGGTANYAGYFTGSWLHVDADSTPDVPVYADGGGDLFVGDEFEVTGDSHFGDATGTDVVTFDSQVATSNGVSMVFPALTSGNGLSITRADNATDFDANLVQILQGNNNATTDAKALYIENQGGSTTSSALYITQTQLSNVTDAAGGTGVGAQALIIDVTEAGSSDDAMLVRANGQVTLVIESDGTIRADNNIIATGADYAEYFDTADMSLAPGEMICQDVTLSNLVKRCEAGNTGVVGVVSAHPGFIGNMPDGTSVAPNFVIVGLTGQIDTYVTDAGGAIAIGDPVTTSQTVAGYGAKAHGPDRILGFALEALPSGSGLIKVYVNPQWYGGDVLTSDGTAIYVSTGVVMASLASASSSTIGVDSHAVAMRGSAWSGSSAVSRSMSISTSVSTADDYRMVVRDEDNVEVAYISNDGDLSLSGRLYPSDRGVAQQNRYIYYDGSSGSGGDFMRTNAAGWSTGSYDFAEMFASPDRLSPGEVVIFGDANETVKRSTNEPYNQRVAGVVSTRPGFLAGENTAGNYPIALAGRVPTYVTGENGPIVIGDPLTSSRRPGYAMKATEAGPIIGYATEAFTGTVGSIIAYINVSYYDGGPAEDGPAAENAISGFVAEVSSFDVSGTLNLNGGSILSISSLQGLGGNWRLQENGDFITRGRLVQLIRSFQGENVETYVSATRQPTIELSGTATLKDGGAVITFDSIDPQFNDIISPTAPYRVLLTPYGATGTLYVAERSSTGFMIREADGMSNGVLVDWLVIAPHKDYAPEPTVIDPPEEDAVTIVETTVEEALSPEPAEVLDALPIVDEVIDEASTDTIETPVTEDVTELEPIAPTTETSTDIEPIATLPEVIEAEPSEAATVSEEPAF
ncbi:MAG: hypothetical protein NUV56_03860, partial [Candidatus Uhrbacteria bacterium]|nr:hypothetical protein [Candidatus Uhrbacteria bacterium]